MASAYLADSLITAAKEEGMLPESDEDDITARVRAILNREQRLFLQALLQKCREEYQTDTASIAVVSGTTEYDIPTRAVGAAIKRLEEVTSAGVGLLYPISSERNSATGGVFATGDFYVRGNKLVLCATPASAATLRVVYARRFNQIVAATAAREITAINTGTKTLTVAAIPADWNTSDTYDLVGGMPHFSVLGKDLTATVASGTTLTMTETLPTDLAVGDYVSLAGETAICNAPLELQDVLVLKAVHSYLSAGGNTQATQLAESRLKQAMEDALVLVSPRVKDTPPLLINYHAPGWNRRGVRRRGQ